MCNLLCFVVVVAVATVVYYMTDMACEWNASARIVNLLVQTAELTAFSPTCLTPAHARLMQASTAVEHAMNLTTENFATTQR